MAGKGGVIPGQGRKKGIPNKVTVDVKEMILIALKEVGGKDYLVVQAKENPKSFMALLGKLLPTQVVGPGDGPLQIFADVRTMSPEEAVEAYKKATGA